MIKNRHQIKSLTIKLDLFFAIPSEHYSAKAIKEQLTHEVFTKL